MKTATYEDSKLEEPSFPAPENLTETLFQLLSSPNITSKESVVRTYDHEVKGNTALKPLQGEYGGPNDAAVIKPAKKISNENAFCFFIWLIMVYLPCIVGINDDDKKTMPNLINILVIQ
jgi:phosphoribosylformylglycinamidine (FGAM) synthase-like enzyme